MSSYGRKLAMHSKKLYVLPTNSHLRFHCYMRICFEYTQPDQNKPCQSSFPMIYDVPSYRFIINFALFFTKNVAYNDPNSQSHMMKLCIKKRTFSLPRLYTTLVQHFDANFQKITYIPDVVMILSPEKM